MTQQRRPKRLAYSIKRAATVSGIGRSSLYLEIKEGRLIARKCGKRTVILRSDLLKWLDQLPVSGGCGSETDIAHQPGRNQGEAT